MSLVNGPNGLGVLSALFETTCLIQKSSVDTPERDLTRKYMREVV